MAVALASLVTMPNGTSSVPCEGLLVDDHGVGVVALCLVGSWLATLAAALSITTASARFHPTLPPSWLARRGPARCFTSMPGAPAH